LGIRLVPDLRRNESGNGGCEDRDKGSSFERASHRLTRSLKPSEVVEATVVGTWCPNEAAAAIKEVFTPVIVGSGLFAPWTTNIA
jgi:hypothetical protein